MAVLVSTIPAQAQDQAPPADCELAYLEMLTQWQAYLAGGRQDPQPTAADPSTDCYVERLRAQVDAFQTAPAQPSPVGETLTTTVATEPTPAPPAPPTPTPEPTATIAVPTPLPPRPPTPTSPPSDATVIRQSLQIQVTGTRLLPEDSHASRYRDRIYILFNATNTGTADIRAFTGVVTFADLFGQTLKQIRLTYDDDPIGIGQTISPTNYYFELNQFITNDLRIRNTNASNLQITFDVASILFMDGRRVGNPNPQ